MGLVIIQLMICLWITGYQVFFNSNLRLFFNQDYFWNQKLEMMLGYDYKLAQALSELPSDANILIVSSDTTWFINYYLIPKRLYYYPSVAKDEDITKIPAEWLKSRGIKYALLYHPPKVNLIDLGAKSGVK